MANYVTIKTLWDKNYNKTQIARITGHDWKTVDKVIKLHNNGQTCPAKKPHPRRIDQFSEQVNQWLEQGLSGVRIHEELRDLGADISYSAVKDYIAGVKRKTDIFIRIHTLPGEEAQVDFGYVGLTPDNKGKRRKTWVFNMRLSYSRLDYYEVVHNQRTETFIQCHINAFRYFGGVPQCVRIDNLKAAILEANFYEPVYQQLYQSFAQYYGFKSIPCRIYKPNDKGKVESGIGYVKKNFFLGRKFADADNLKRQLSNWLDKTCNGRIHGTTRKIPLEVFKKEERKYLKPLPACEFKLPQVGARKVYHDCHIYVDYNYYSVPFEYVGCCVDIESDKNMMRIFHKGALIAVHQKPDGKGNFVTNQAHYPKYKTYSQTEFQEKYQVKFTKIGPYAEQLFFLLLKNQHNAWIRTASGIISLTKQYETEVVDLACKRALAYGVCQYRAIRNICKNGSYNLPVEFNVEEAVYEYA